jgi:hypothetical protein
VVGSNTIQSNFSLTKKTIFSKKQGHITLPRCVTLDNSANFATVELVALRNPVSKIQNAWQQWMQFLLEKVLVSLSTCIISFIYIWARITPAAGRRELMGIILLHSNIIVSHIELRRDGPGWGISYQHTWHRKSVCQRERAALPVGTIISYLQALRHRAHPIRPRFCCF